MNVANRNQSLVKSEICHYFIRLTICPMWGHQSSMFKWFSSILWTYLSDLPEKKMQLYSVFLDTFNVHSHSRGHITFSTQFFNGSQPNFVSPNQKPLLLLSAMVCDSNILINIMTCSQLTVNFCTTFATYHIFHCDASTGLWLAVDMILEYAKLFSYSNHCLASTHTVLLVKCRCGNFFLLQFRPLCFFPLHFAAHFFWQLKK